VVPGVIIQNAVVVDLGKSLLLVNQLDEVYQLGFSQFLDLSLLDKLFIFTSLHYLKEQTTFDGAQSRHGLRDLRCLDVWE
jgi:hypothetical protein